MVGRLAHRLTDSSRLFLSLARNRSILAAQVAFLLFTASEYGTWVAFLLYAYDATGPTSVGVVALVLLIPATLFAPVAASLGDRLSRERFLLLGYVCQTLSLVGTAVAMAVGTSPAIVYAMACVVSAAMTMTRPAHGALLPSLARTPEELTAANGLSAVFEGAGVLLGPLAAAAILVSSTPTVVVEVGAAAVIVSAVLATRVRVASDRVVASIELEGPADGEDAAISSSDEAAGSVLDELRSIARDRGFRLLAGLLSSRMLLIGAYDVLFVLLALDLFDTGESGAGVLSAALGAGGVVGGAVTLGVASRRRLGPALVLGALVAGLCVIAIAMAPSALTAPLLIAVSGLGLSLLDATGRTMLQRSVPDATLAGAFGVLEGLAMAGLGLGSVLVPILVASLGLREAVLAVGLILPVLGVLAIPGLRRLDATSVVPERELALLGRVEMFAPLRPQVLESLAHRSSWTSMATGSIVIHEGEVGDRFFVLASGALDVAKEGRHLRTLARPGDAVGEIALLFDVPRTATVTVSEDAELLVLERADFLTAVTGHPEVHRAATRVAGERMSER
jgi:MFS family permease